MAICAFWPVGLFLLRHQRAYETTGMDVLMVAKGYEIGWDDSNFRLYGLEAN